MDDVERGGAAGAETSNIGAVAAPGRERRMTAGRKRDAVLRVLRGEPLEIVARELAVTAADLSGWREAFLDAGAASLKSRARDDRDETIARLRTKVGELTMDTELLHAKIERLEAGAHPIAAGCHGGPGVAVPLLRRGGRSPPHAAGCVGAPAAMSTVISIATRRRYGVARICRVWGVARAGVYRRRGATEAAPAPRRRPGPLGPMPDAALVEAIRQVLTDSPFHGEGYRKVPPGPAGPVPSGNRIDRLLTIDGRGCVMRACGRRRNACAA